jgi:UDP-N-acetylmuramyl pentapeptide phosphotransferase/UDP-N-acetylglucosamine-1-phosphate transferase
MNNWIIPLAITSVVSFAISLFATKFLIGYLLRKNVLDTPNERSNHKVAVPRGGGLAIVGTILLMYGVAGFSHSHIFTENYMLVLCPLIFAIISFMDDLKPMPARWRFLTQIVMVSGSVVILLDDKLLFQGLLPQWLDHFCIAIGWIWFINLFNFMDGIDGISGVESGSICAGIIGVAALTAYPHANAFLPAIIGFSTLGFLWWNWHPAKIFMGDVGSIPLGYLLGYLLLMLATSGYLAAAVIIPLYYLADATYTITKRLLQRKKIWQPHSEHFYQQAVRAGVKHNIVARQILMVNLCLVGLALSASINTAYELYNVAAAGVLVALFLYKLKSAYAH